MQQHYDDTSWEQIAVTRYVTVKTVMENHLLRQGNAALATAVALPRCADRLFLKEYTKVQKQKGNLHVLRERDGVVGGGEGGGNK